MLLYSCKSNHTSAAIQLRLMMDRKPYAAPEEISTNATQMCFSLLEPKKPDALAGYLSGSPTDFLRLITPPPSPLPLPSAPLLKKIALLKFQFDLVGEEETGTLFCDHGTIIINWVFIYDSVIYFQSSSKQIMKQSRRWLTSEFPLVNWLAEGH